MTRTGGTNHAANLAWAYILPWLCLSCSSPPLPPRTEPPPQVAAPQPVTGAPLAEQLDKSETQPPATRHRLALALVMDRSGSMSGKRIEMAKAACQAAIARLLPDDEIAVVAFDSSPRVIVSLRPAAQRLQISENIKRLRAGGGTELFSALDKAYNVLLHSSLKRKHVVLVTDGRAPYRGIDELVEAIAADGISLSTVALGSETDEQLLRKIAQNGKGRFLQVADDAIAELPGRICREIDVAAVTPPPVYPPAPLGPW